MSSLCVKFFSKQSYFLDLRKSLYLSRTKRNDPIIPKNFQSRDILLPFACSGSVSLLGQMFLSKELLPMNNFLRERNKVI